MVRNIVKKLEAALKGNIFSFLEALDKSEKQCYNINRTNVLQVRRCAVKKQYIAIDLKSFYASVECVEKDLDPLDTNLVVADKSRTDKTICLAVSPSLKA